MTDAPPADAAAEPPPEPVPDGLDDLIRWLEARVPAIQRAKMTEQVIQRLTDEVRDPALRYAWEHRADSATMRDLEAATGINRARITWALGRHPRAMGD